MQSLANLLSYFSISQFMPHGNCYMWLTPLLLLNVLSDAAIAISYMIIPVALFVFVRKRKEHSFTSVYVLFGLFIFLCGLTHLMEVVTVWRPEYWIAGFIKAATAIVSLITVYVLVSNLSKIIAMPSRDKLIETTEALEKSETKFKTFVEYAPDAMVITNQEGKILIVNAQAEKIFGYDKAEMAGLNIEMLIPDRYRDKHEIHRTHFFSNPHTRPMGPELTLFGLKKDGSEFPVEISLSPVQTEEGMLALAAIRDITDKKHIEKLLIEKNVQLVNSDLAKDQFLTHMSHELRTPLNGIIVMTQMLLAGELEPEQKEKIEVINESNEQLLAVINQILDFSKVESGNIGVEQVDFVIRDLVQKLVASYVMKAEAKDIIMSYQIDPAIPEHLIGDMVKVKQILSNLLDNAVKFTEKGTIKLNLSVVQKDDVMVEVQFDVTDTGIGIDPEVLPKLFKPFSQGDSSMTRKYGGTGLGLAISKRLVEVMGGSINVNSSEEGSQFIFTVPFIYNKKLMTTPAKTPLPASAIHGTNGKRGNRILIAEDNKLNQRTLTILLGQLGFSVYLVSDGIEVLKELQKQEFDLILMDCQMPNMDGYQATIEIRRQEEGTGKHIPIIGVTAHAMEGSREKCLASGMDNYISKPFSIAHLNRLINKYLYTAQQGASE